MKKGKVVLGMSGGVDSSVAALILKNKGYEVIGIFQKNFSDNKDKFTGECWWREELENARTIANILEIPLFVEDHESEYKNKVIKPMISLYSKNKTPNPDVECNNITKFPNLLKAAKKHKADFIATGHYAQITKINKTFFVKQGKDKTKDQSYFLYKLNQKDLSRTLFPIGDKTKKEIREIAKNNKFPNWNKHGSAGVCFIGNIPLQEYLKKHISSKKGRVVDESGKVIGNHDGTQFYTIGQKAAEHFGININKPKKNAQKRYYVAKKLPKNTLLVVPERSNLLKTSQVIIKKSTSQDKIKINKEYLARYRHLGPLVKGRLIKNRGKLVFKFKKPQESLASGQSIVIYENKKVVLGGEMEI